MSARTPHGRVARPLRASHTYALGQVYQGQYYAAAQALFQHSLPKQALSASSPLRSVPGVFQASCTAHLPSQRFLTCRHFRNPGRGSRTGEGNPAI